jgi:hypothetical protein
MQITSGAAATGQHLIPMLANRQGGYPPQRHGGDLGGQLPITGCATGTGQHPLPMLANRQGGPHHRTRADSCSSPATRRAPANT